MTRGVRSVVVVAVLAVAVSGLAMSFVPFFRGRTATPARADAVVVLSGDHGERLPSALGLIDRGVTSTLVFAGDLDSGRALELCGVAQPFEVICLRPDPDNTREEARDVARLASRRGWKTIVVVTSRHHVPRSELLFDRCVDGDVFLVGADPPFGPRMLLRNRVREWVGVFRSLTVARGC